MALRVQKGAPSALLLLLLYPVYRRRHNGRHFVSRSGFDFDNRWVVPYNPFLTLKYNCHINVEVCSSVAAVKYLYKYVYKGHDRAMIEVRERAGAPPTLLLLPRVRHSSRRARDEVKAYLDGRYVSASSAIHRLFSFGLHEEHPNVVRLQVHLPISRPSCPCCGRQR